MGWGDGIVPRALRFLAGCGLCVAGCRGLGGERPRIVPLPGSAVRVVSVRPDSATRLLGAALAASNVPTAVVAPAEGYVESGWYDVDRGAVRAPSAGRLERVVKLRFFADPTAGQTRVVGEAVRRIMVDPSLPERELERLVPEEHPGRLLMDSVMVRALGPEPRSSAPRSRTS